SLPRRPLMPGTNSHRTRAAAMLVAGVVALALIGCGKHGQGVVEPTSSGDSQIGGNPTATPSTGELPSPSSTISPTSAVPLFPKDAKSYGFELFKAWAGPDYDRIGQLADSST